MRYSLLHLFGLMAFIAIGLGALAGPSSLMANIVFTITVLVFCALLVGMILAIGRLRAFCVAFFVFGGAHLLLTLAPWLDAHTGNSLLTRDALDALGAAMGHQVLNRNTDPAGVWRGLHNWVVGTPPHIYVTFVLIGQCWFSIAIGWLAGVVASRFVQPARDGRP